MIGETVGGAINDLLISRAKKREPILLADTLETPASSLPKNDT